MDNRSSFSELWDELYGSSFNESSYTDPCCEEGDVCDLEEGMEFGATFIPVLYSVAFVVGILGNGVLLGVLARSRRNWSVTDTFILHLTLADVLLLVTLPFWAAQAAQDHGWSFGTPLCKITGAVFMVRGVQQERCTKILQKKGMTINIWWLLISVYLQINFYCGIFLLACISLDRYLSIIHATQMYSRRKPWAVHVSCSAVWLFSLLLSIPDLIFFEAVEDDRRNNKVECARNYLMFVPDLQDNVEAASLLVANWQLASRLILHIVGFLLPSAVMIFSYSRILQRLRCGSQGFQKQKAVRVIIAVVVVFFLCWAPYNITVLVDTLQSNFTSESCGVSTSLQKASVITSSMGYLHCSLNPILYAFVGVKFRRQLLDILRSLGCKLKTSATFKSAVSSRRSSIWSESGDTSNSIAI